MSDIDTQLSEEQREAEQASVARCMQEGEEWLEAKRMVAKAADDLRHACLPLMMATHPLLQDLLMALERLAKVEKMEGLV